MEDGIIEIIVYYDLYGWRVLQEEVNCDLRTKKQRVNDDQHSQRERPHHVPPTKVNQQ